MGGISQSGRPASGRSRKRMTADLPPHRRQLVDEHDLARNLLVRERLRDVLTQLGLELLGPSVRALRHDEGPNEVTTSLKIANADDCGRCNGFVAFEHALDVVRAERPTAARDHVLRATDEREEALLVHVRDVSGHVPVAEEGRLRLLWKLPVSGEQRRRAAANGEVAFDPGGKLVALVVDDGHVVSGERATERPGLDLRRPRGSPIDDVRLGLPVAVRDRQAPALFEDGDDLRVEEVAGGDEPPQARRPEALELGMLGERAVLGRRLTEDGRREPEREGRGARLRRTRRAAGRSRRHARRGRSLCSRIVRGARRRRCAPDGVAASDVEPVLSLHARREHASVRVSDVSSRTADPARRDDEGEVARGRVVCRDVDGDVLGVPLGFLRRRDGPLA